LWPLMGFSESIRCAFLNEFEHHLLEPTLSLCSHNPRTRKLFMRLMCQADTLGPPAMALFRECGFREIIALIRK
jgi:hypothetical protein